MPSPAASRRTRWVCGWLAALCLAALTTGISAADVGPADLTGSAVVPRPSAVLDRTAAVTQLLDRRGQAIRSRDRAAFLATVDPFASEFRQAQAALFDNMAGVALSDWRFRLLPGTGYPAVGPAFSRYGGATVWVPPVELAYALADIDPVPVVQQQAFTFVRRGTGWFVAADDDLAEAGHPTWRGLWDFGPVVTTRGRSSVVLSHPDQSVVAAGLAAELDRATDAVTAAWGPGWARSVAALLPGSQQEMAALLGGDPDLDRIAALATAASTAPVTGQRIVLNPDTLDAMSPTGRQVVLRHEVTHVATRGSTTPATPTWLAEGFADYVGYLGSGVPLSVAAADLAGAVRRGAVPTELPDAAGFAGDSVRLEQSYQEAWLACLLLVRRIGPAGLVRLYRDSATGTAATGTAATGTAALEAATGTTYPQFVRDWQRYLVERLR